ncbi:P1 family peptidase [Conexibacter woesei]|uniref:DmpA family aminopeptidase n=1 Tax=Conexibacter woesei TaxID=191495 RepID=UPI00040C57F4|nr:P1 family peptidase [Conexibacter woesei]
MSERPRARARELGIDLEGTPGTFNAITDVPGVEVGYATLVEGDDVRTGVTAILPLGRDGVGCSCPAGWSALNGNGELTGTHWLTETGALALPVGITNTHAVGPVHRGIVEWSVAQRPELGDRWLLPVVGETWDGYLNDLNGRHVTAETVVDALDRAAPGPLAEGSVGGGTGMNVYGYKGGTGTASRVVEVAGAEHTVGVLTQANFGARRELTIAGRRVGRVLAHDDNPIEDSYALAPPGAGSCICVVATDAPLLPAQCTALARRVPLGLARTGTTGSHYSGDLFLAFSATNMGALDSDMYVSGTAQLEFVPWGLIDPLYEAVVQAVEESVLNVLAASETVVGRAGHVSPGFPAGRLDELL